MAKKILGNNKLEDCITQKFQALIIKMVALRLVTQAGMRQCFRQEE